MKKRGKVSYQFPFHGHTIRGFWVGGVIGISSQRGGRNRSLEIIDLQVVVSIRQRSAIPVQVSAPDELVWNEEQVYFQGNSINKYCSCLGMSRSFRVCEG